MAEYSKQFYIKGIKETLDTFQELAEDIGDKKATSRFLLPALKAAMTPVLYAAKQLVRSDTGLLRDNLEIKVGRPTSKDKRSKYIHGSDVAIARVQTKPIAPKHRKEVESHIFEMKKLGFSSSKKKLYTNRGYFYDARAIANEFGTANVSARPFLRPALEGQAQTVLELLSVTLDQRIRKYRSKTPT